MSQKPRKPKTPHPIRTEEFRDIVNGAIDLVSEEYFALVAKGLSDEEIEAKLKENLPARQAKLGIPRLN